MLVTGERAVHASWRGRGWEIAGGGGSEDVVLTSAESTSPELVELPLPESQAGEVRVKVAGASINGFDLSMAAGHTKAHMEHRYPLVLGKDFAGTVEAVGPDTDGFDVGDRVFGTVTKEFLGDGSFAEYVTMPVQVGIAHLPETVSFVDGAALGLAGAAAYAALDAARIDADTSVLVVGATGGWVFRWFNSPPPPARRSPAPRPPRRRRSC